MKVVHVGKFYPPHRGGMESHLQDLCRELVKSVDVTALVAHDAPDDSEDVDQGIQIVRCGTKATLAGVQLCPSLFSRLRHTTGDILHLHWPNPSGALAILRSGLSCPVVVTYHSDIIRQRLLSQLIKPLELAFFARCSAIIATSQRYLDSSKSLQRFHSKCTVVPLGIPSEKWQLAGDAPTPTSYDHSSQSNSRLVVAAGRLVYYKGFHTLIDAMKEVDGRLVLVGSGPLRETLTRQVKRLNIAGKVTLVGEVESLTPFLEACDVFVLPSTERSEAFGLVQLEAMACSRPVVNTDLDTGVPWVSIHGETGVTVRPGDPRALAAALNQLLADAPLRRRLGCAGRNRVRAHFTAERMARAILELYGSLL